MDLPSDPHEHWRSRAMAAAEIVALALERNLPHMALAAAQEAARSALLVLAGAPRPRRLAGPDVELLEELAASSPQHMAGRPAERQALVRAALSVLDRVFPRPPAPAQHDPSRGGGAGQPPCREPPRQLRPRGGGCRHGCKEPSRPLGHA